MMRLYRKFICYGVLVCFLSSCAALGSQTIYRTDKAVRFNRARIGYSQLANEEGVNRTVINTSTFYNRAVKEYLAQKNVESVRLELPPFDNLREIDRSSLVKLCEIYNLDGILVGQLKYIYVNYYTLLIPIGQSQDTEVEMQYFDSNGSLLIHTRHNTHQGNSYMFFPSADKTVGDGTIGALNKMMQQNGYTTQ